MTKTLNQIFFFLHQNQNIFFRNIGNQNIFLEKNHKPPFKLNGRSLMVMLKSNLRKISTNGMFVVYFVSFVLSRFDV